MSVRVQGSTTTDWSSDDRSVISDDSSVSCVNGSTAIDALRLALGSTLGAFIALAIVVAIVLLAKCQHRRRLRRVRRRRRRYSDKSQALTDCDNVSFFDDYDYNDDNDDDYGSVFDDKAQNEDVAVAEFSRRSSPPPRHDETRLAFTDEFIVTDDGDVAGRKWTVGDISAPFYDVTRDRESAADIDQPRAETDSTQCDGITGGIHAKSAFDSSVTCPAVLLSGVADDGNGRPVVGQGFPIAPSSMSMPRCFNYDVFKPAAGPKSEVLRLTTYIQPGAAGIVDVTPPDSCDTTGLLSTSDVERTTGGLKPNRYSSLW